MEWILEKFHSLQSQLQAFGQTSSSSLKLDLQRPGQINDSVYLVCQPPGRPSIEIVFVHGLNVDGSKEAYLKTWLSSDGTELWLRWILKDVPDARILFIAYDASVRTTHEEGLMDYYSIGENLVHDLSQAEVGQDGCPVVFVGHSIGCLVMKELCIALDSAINKLLPHSLNEPWQNLFFNVKGLFYYACPHHGSELADKSTVFLKGPLFQELVTLNKEAGRRNEDFRKLHQKYGWTTCGIVEGCPTALMRGFSCYLCPF